MGKRFELTVVVLTTDDAELQDAMDHVYAALDNAPIHPGTHLIKGTEIIVPEDQLPDAPDG